MIRLLATRGWPDAAQHIRPRLTDVNPGVRATAVIGLMTLDDPSVVHFLDDCSEEEHPEVQHHLQRAYAKFRLYNDETR